MRMPLAKSLFAMAGLALAAPLLSASGTAGTTAVASVDDVPTLFLAPAELDRGGNARIPYLDGKTIVDGSRRIPVRAEDVELYGRSGTAYIVRTESKSEARTLVRVGRDGRWKVLDRHPSSYIQLSNDGRRVGMFEPIDSDGSTAQVIDARTGARVASRFFRSAVFSLDFGRRVLLTDDLGRNGRTFWWDVDRDTITVVKRASALYADIPANRLVYETDGNWCSALSKLTAPSVVLWRSCRETAVAVSPDGERFATLPADLNQGQDQVILRAADGRTLVRYRANFFSKVRFDTERSLLLEVWGRRWAAEVRCVRLSCHRASALTRW
ncbi:hypothetical protein [Nocardioides speluncae]|uniref:hypothetical protein n=1 Tax=Nocardioides speluncae TaxID=2670337 RepID=UPI000D68CCBC|nr:hypothetical protein [Nocardioides speluncae]